MNAVELRAALHDAADRFATKCIAGHDELEIHGSYVLELEVNWQGSTAITHDMEMADLNQFVVEPLFGATERVNIPRQLHEF